MHTLDTEKFKKGIDYLKSQPNWKLIPMTISMDIRRNEYKYTVIDANIFPSGHNNILPEHLESSAEGLKKYLTSQNITSGPIAIYPEFMTKNQFYGDNLARILEVCELADLQPRLYWRKDMEGPYSHEGLIPSNPHALEWATCIWLNNDLSGGVPEELKHVNIPIFPSPKMGWYQRKKSTFFDNFNLILEDLEKIMESSLDFMKIRHRVVQVTDLFNDEDLQKLYKATKDLELEIKQTEKYKSSFFIKNNHGTFGLGVLGIQSPEEILNLNMRKKQNLSLSKDKVGSSEFLIQEGIPSDLYKDEQICEEVIMGLGGKLITRIMRCHETKTPYDSLNARGMKLIPSTKSICPHCESLLFHVSLAATSKELENL